MQNQTEHKPTVSYIQPWAWPLWSPKLSTYLWDGVRTKMQLWLKYTLDTLLFLFLMFILTDFQVSLICWIFELECVLNWGLRPDYNVSCNGRCSPKRKSLHGSWSALKLCLHCTYIHKCTRSFLPKLYYVTMVKVHIRYCAVHIFKVCFYTIMWNYYFIDLT